MTTSTLTTEDILTSPVCFGLLTASPVQRAICRILDGLPLGDLASCDDVIVALGGTDAVRALPVGEPPFEVHLLAGIRSGKSLIAAAHIIRASQTVDVSRLGPGDQVRHLVVSLKLSGARAIMNHLSANLATKPALRALCIGEPSVDLCSIRHPSGCQIDNTPIPLDRAGGSALETWGAGITIDEQFRMFGADDGVRNWSDTRDAADGRLLPGAQAFGLGSAWAPYGPGFSLVQKHFGKPSRDIVVIRGRGPAMNPVWWSPARCEDLRRRNPGAYRTDVDCEFQDEDSALIAASEIEAARRTAPLELPRRADRRYVGAIDPATRRNAFALIILEIEEPKPFKYKVALSREWLPKGKPLDPLAVLHECALYAAGYGLTALATDQFSGDAMRALAKQAHLTLTVHPRTQAANLDAFDTLRIALTTGRLELSPDPMLRNDLVGLRKRITQSGVSIHLPETPDGRHADLAAALALAIDIASKRSAHPTVRAHAPVLTGDDPYGTGGPSLFSGSMAVLPDPERLADAIWGPRR